jgi:hypothetical protein
VNPGLASSVKPVASLNSTEVAVMIQLMQSYYADVTSKQFEADLWAKNRVILLHAATTGELVGFSTIGLWQDRFCEQNIQVMYSGDTVIDHRHWGSLVFARTWLKVAANIKKADATMPLYWLLIVKGHRTYRFLDVFSRHYYPAWNQTAPPDICLLMHSLAIKKFGDDYDTQSGVVRMARKANRLLPHWAEVPSKDTDRPEVKFFQERNPYYHLGDELVCLTEVAALNMKPFARRIFEDAFRE